jgi:hypothetical protein
MALSLQSSVFIKQRVQAFPGLSARLTILVNAFLSLLTTHSGDPDLQFVPFSLAPGATLTAANVGARIYAVVLFAVTPGGFLLVTVGDSGDDPAVTLEPVETSTLDTQEAAVFFPGGIFGATNSDVTVANDGGATTTVQGFVMLGAP